MTTLHPEFRVVNVGTDDFIVASNFVFRSHQLEKSVVNDSSMGFEKSAAGSQVSKVEKSLLGTDVSMVSLSQFLLDSDVLIEFSLFWEWNGINSLQVIVVLVAQPVSSWVFSNLETLDFIGWREMRAGTEIDQVAAPVRWSVSVLRNFVLNQLQLKWIVLEHLQCLVLGQKNSFVWLFLLSIFLDFLFDLLVIGLWQFLVAGKWIIKETWFQGWAMTEPGAIQVLKTLTQ